jgi:hypothetical protein
VTCFRLVTTMINGGADEVVLARAVPELRNKLKLVQGSPTAVGTGKSSLRRKARALLHSTRRVTDSWRSAIRLLNSTMSFTGDLGVESGLWTFVEDARSLIGNWIMDADAGPDAPPDGDRQSPNDDFSMEAEPQLLAVDGEEAM